jgi:hypothetical protein
MGTEDPGWNVLQLAKRHGIDERLVINESRNAIPGVATHDLNAVYSACDAGLNTATGEGWGLPDLEHAAAGKAQVVPRFGALAEIRGACAELVEPVMEVVHEGVLSEGSTVSAEGVAAALEGLYGDRARLRRVAEACYRRATEPRFRWDAIA